MPTTTITRQVAYELLNALDRGTPACIFTRTQPKMRKTDNPYIGNCQRLARRHVFIGVDYESCAQRLLDRYVAEFGQPTEQQKQAVLALFKQRIEWTNDQPTRFQAGPLPWGQHDGRYFITHKGYLYLKFYPVPGTLDDSWRTLDDQPIELDEIQPFLYQSDNLPIPWRTVQFGNLEQINVNKEQFQLTN